MVEQVEEIPALMNWNLVRGNLPSSQFDSIGRYPFISVIDPPMKATRAVFFFSNAKRELENELRLVKFSVSKARSPLNPQMQRRASMLKINFMGVDYQDKKILLQAP